MKKDKFSTNVIVGPSHLNGRGVLSVRSLVDFMQDCSIFQLDSERELDKFFKDNNSGMFLSQRQIEIIRLPKHGEHLTLKTWVYKCNPSYGFRNTNVYDEDGVVCIASSAIGAFVNYATGKMLRVPQDIIETVPIYAPYEMEYLPRKISISKDAETEQVVPFYVWRFMIDANNHVNNARYISLAQEFLPADFEIKRIRVEYLLPAKQGEWIYPEVTKIDDGYIISLNSEEDKKYAIVEFVK